MAVVARKYKSRITFYAVNDWRGKQVAERIGPNQREAALRDRTMKKEIKACTYQPPMSVVARTTGGYIESWLKERTNAYAPDERRMVKLYLEPREWLMEKPLDEVVPSDTDRLVKELRGEKKPDGSRRLSDKTIANVLGLMKQVFAAGIRADLCIRQPITLPPRTPKRTSAKEKEIYTPAEVVVLTRHHSIPWPIRVLNARRGSVNHSRSSYYKAFIKYAEVAGVRPRSLHSTRHTFITLAQRCGARKEHVERITHNARGDIVDRYTHMWSPLCEAMLCLNLEVLPDVHPASRTPGNSGGAIELFGVRNLQKPGQMPYFQRVSIPGALEWRLTLLLLYADDPFEVLHDAGKTGPSIVRKRCKHRRSSQFAVFARDLPHCRSSDVPRYFAELNSDGLYRSTCAAVGACADLLAA
jgi:hypothetical protein